MKRAILFTFGTVMMAWIIWQADLDSIRILLGTKHVLLVIIAALISMAIIFLKPLRWKYMVSRLGIENQGYWRYFELVGASFFIGTITPNRLGEFTRVLVSNQRLKMTAAFAVEYMIDIFTILTIPAIFSVMILYNLLAVAGILIIGIIITSLPLFIAHLKILDRLFIRFFPKKRWILEHKKEVLQNIRRYFRNRNVFLVTSLLSIVQYMVVFTMGFLLFRSFGMDVGFIKCVAGLSIGHIIGILSFVPVGIGTREVSTSAIFIAFGFDAGLIYSALIVYRLFTLFPVAVSYFLYIRFSHKKFR